MKQPKMLIVCKPDEKLRHKNEICVTFVTVTYFLHNYYITNTPFRMAYMVAMVYTPAGLCTINSSRELILTIENFASLGCCCFCCKKLIPIPEPIFLVLGL